MNSFVGSTPMSLSLLSGKRHRLGHQPTAWRRTHAELEGVAHSCPHGRVASWPGPHILAFLLEYKRALTVSCAGIFQGILSEYLALKYGPQVVYMDFRDFLVTGYIYPHIVGCALAYPLCKIKSIAEKIKGCQCSIIVKISIYFLF